MNIGSVPAPTSDHANKQIPAPILRLAIRSIKSNDLPTHTHIQRARRLRQTNQLLGRRYIRTGGNRRLRYVGRRNSAIAVHLSPGSKPTFRTTSPATIIAAPRDADRPRDRQPRNDRSHGP